MWEYRQRFVRELFAHEVPIMAGTDTGTPYMVPGFALHKELELLSAPAPLPARPCTPRPSSRPGSSG